MIRIKLMLIGYLKNKYLTDTINTIELSYKKPVKAGKVLEDAKILPADVFIIKAEDSIIKEDYLLIESGEVKLFPVIGGG